MIQTVSDRFIQSLPSLTSGDLRLVSKFAGSDRFTVGEAVTATGFTERAVRRCLQRLHDCGFVKTVAHGSPGSPSWYRICLSEDGSAMAS